MNKIYKCLELFSGNGDITNKLNKYDNIICHSVDYNENYEATYHKNVYELSEEFLKTYDFIWLSPDCTTYSFAAHGIHRRKGNIPVSDYAKYCTKNNRALIEMLKKNDVPFIIENPRAFMRQEDFVKDLKRITIYYSAYGTPYSKPTDLFSNRDISSYFNQTIINTGVCCTKCFKVFRTL